MDSFNHHKNETQRKEKKTNEPFGKIYGITRVGKYYFPGKISSGCFDGIGNSAEDEKREQRTRNEDLYESSVDREFDPDGMYTGRPQDEFDRPVQDADDL